MPAARLRTQKSTRPRPKTIHVEHGSVDLSDASSLASRGKKGSSSNLTGEIFFFLIIFLLRTLQI